MLKHNIQEKINFNLSKITNLNLVNYFGRANTAIWSIASYLKKKNKKKTIILPSTMCVSPAIIFLVNDFKLLFVDVDKKSGLMNINKALKIINSRNDICACFYVNLFGNKDANSIKLKKNNKKILIIQDLAQTFLHKEKITKKELFGDILILSFGYSKIFDLNHGGIILSNKVDLYNFANEFNEKMNNKKIGKIGKKYYLNWYRKTFFENKKIYLDDVKKFAKKLYLIKFDKTKLLQIYRSINSINNEFKRRSNLLKNYKKFTKNVNIDVLHSKSTMIPWRFSFLIKKNRDIILKKLREKGYDASSYYPNIANRFKKDNKNYPNSDIIEKNIVNLWLTKNYNAKKVIDQVKIFKKYI